MAKVAKKKSRKLTAKKTAPKKAVPKKKAIAKKKAAPKRVAAKKSAPKARKAKKVTKKKAAPKRAAAKAPKPAVKHAAPVPKSRPRAAAAGHAKGHASSGRSDGGRAFLPDTGTNRSGRDDLAEELGEDFVSAATSGESTDDAHDAPQTEEDGGPFITTSAESQYAPGTDASNPEGADREPFPRTHGGQ